MTSLDNQVLDTNGVWSGDVYDGNYDFVLKLDGQSHTCSNSCFTNDASFSFIVTAVPDLSSLVLLGACASAAPIDDVGNRCEFSRPIQWILTEFPRPPTSSET
jgi:hypothetical protein